MAHRLQISPEEVEVFCAKMRSALRDPALYAYVWVYVIASIALGFVLTYHRYFVYGQKPK
jgi:hypothetical protein